MTLPKSTLYRQGSSHVIVVPAEIVKKHNLQAGNKIEFNITGIYKEKIEKVPLEQ